MIKDAIYVDYNNKEHVKWWNKIARSKFVKFEFLSQVAEKETGKICGAVFAIKGLLTKLVVRKNNSFIKDRETIIFQIKD
jgi:hypothetical protein